MCPEAIAGSKQSPNRVGGGKKRGRKPGARQFPASSFEEALAIPNAIQKHAAGQQVRRLTLFDNMGKSPDSGPSRQMVSNASKYGLIKGNYKSEFLELTQDGSVATSTEATPRERLLARFRLAIKLIDPFLYLYKAQSGKRLPALPVLEDSLKEANVSGHDVKECVETFIVNAKYLGILKSLAGAERIIPIEQAMEELAEPRLATSVKQEDQSLTGSPVVSQQAVGKEEWDKVCFYIAPIGESESEQRKHSDLFLGSIIEPALEEFGLKVVRADQIGKPGMITKQVIEYILKARLVIADLSFHNPNVFYELSLRHACCLPTVHVIRSCEKIPFDLEQFRTIQIDVSSIYALVPNLQTHKAEIASQVRAVLKDPDSADNPIRSYCPGLKVQGPLQQ